MNMFKQMKEYLKERTDFEVLRGYREAKADYEETKNPMVKGALDVIKKEMDRRGIKDNGEE